MKKHCSIGQRHLCRKNYYLETKKVVLLDHIIPINNQLLLEIQFIKF